MRKTFMALVFGALLIGVTMSANAAVMQLEAGSYEKPAGWETIGSMSYLSLDHWMYYEFRADDLYTNVEQVDVVFHSIYNYAYEQNSLNLYIMDYDEAQRGWSESFDAQQTDNPDWSAWAHLGTWSYPESSPGPNADPADDTYDVLFTIVDDAVLEMMNNGNGFILGIDPDCHYYGGGMSINAPVPEPATLLLLGTGVAGIAAARRRKIKKA